MAKLMTPEEAAAKALAKQAAKVAAVEAKRAARTAEREQKRDAKKLFAAHCADAAKAFKAGSEQGAYDSLEKAMAMLINVGGLGG